MAHSFEKFYEPAFQFAVKRLALPISTQEDDRERAVWAATILVERHLSTSWPIVWAAISEDEEFGRRIVSRLANWHRSADFATSLHKHCGAQEVAEFFVLLERRFPRATDPQFEGCHGVGEREAIGDLRDSLLYELQRSDNAEALSALISAEQQLPHMPYLRDIRVTVETRVRATKWRAPNSEQLIQLLRKRENRYVQSHSDLLDLVVEAVEKFDLTLTSNRMQWLLWNETPTGGKPKDEDQLSQILAWHLHHELGSKRGVVVNREVDVTLKRFIDIVASLTVPDNNGFHDTLSVGIEVKGCWHAKLLTAMESQLKVEYLSKGSREHGVYAVFWFLCDEWNPESRRTKAVSIADGKNVMGMRTHLADQAADLSRDWAWIRSVVIDGSFDSAWIASRTKRKAKNK